MHENHKMAINKIKGEMIMNLAEINNALSGMDPAEVALGAGMVGVIGTLMAIGALIWFLVPAFGFFKMLKKGGQRGWFAFIPLLRDYALFKMAWTVKAFIICTVLLAVLQLGGESENIVVSLVAAVSGIAYIVMQVKLMLRLAKSFGKGTGWGLLLFFIPFIAALILGFGSAEYVGNPEAQKLPEEESAPGEV
jgi:hypothetical protein